MSSVFDRIRQREEKPNVKKKKTKKSARKDPNEYIDKPAICSQILDLARSDDFTINRVLRVQERIQKIVPAYQREPDHLLVIMKEVGEHLAEIEPIFKDWRKDGDKTENDINWEAAKEELADILILQARAIVDTDQYKNASDAVFLRNSLSDAIMRDESANTMGQLLCASVVPFMTPTMSLADMCASFYYLAQYAGRLPFGVGGLQEAWRRKVTIVAQRNYGSI